VKESASPDTTASPTQSFVTVSGGRLAYDVRGAGPALIFSHGRQLDRGSSHDVSATFVASLGDTLLRDDCQYLRQRPVRDGLP
jgi:hypothetical protein